MQSKEVGSILGTVSKHVSWVSCGHMIACIEGRSSPCMTTFVVVVVVAVVVVVMVVVTNAPMFAPEEHRWVTSLG